MSVKIRLMRVGKKKQPSYRVVVADERKARDGRFIEIIGQYAPRSEPSHVNIDSEREAARHHGRVGRVQGKVRQGSCGQAQGEDAQGQDAEARARSAEG